MSASDSLYSRQSSLTLKMYHTVYVVGCGGIGNWVALDLALSGCVSNLVLIDPDEVEESNLNRTTFEYCDIGCFKVDALASQIMRKRPSQTVITVSDYMTKTMVETIIRTRFGNDNSYYRTNVCVVDCRDDIYDDVFELNCKLYKVGYDGVWITMDGNPRLTKVFGQRGGSYRVTPSYVCSSQLAAILVVNDMLYPTAYRLIDEGKVDSNIIDEIETFCDGEEFCYLQERTNGPYDELGRLNDSISFNCQNIPFKYIDNNKEEYNFAGLRKEKSGEENDG